MNNINFEQDVRVNSRDSLIDLRIYIPSRRGRIAKKSFQKSRYNCSQAKAQALRDISDDLFSTTDISLINQERRFLRLLRDGALKQEIISINTIIL